MRLYLLLLLVPLTACLPRAIPLAHPHPSAVPEGGIRTTHVVAHRGGGGESPPENSLRAFRKAMEVGADFLEVDVHLTRDDEVVIMHDNKLDRTSTGRGPIRSLRLDELSHHRLRHARGVSDEAIPRLEDLLRILDDRVRLLIELKHSGSGCYNGLAERVVRLVEAYGLTGRTMVISFHLEDLKRVRRLSPEIPVGALVDCRQVGSWLAPGQFARRLARDGVSFMGINWRFLGRRAIAAAHLHGLQLAAWTVNKPRLVRRLVGLPLDMIISDRPEMVAKYARGEFTREKPEKKRRVAEVRRKSKKPARKTNVTAPPGELASNGASGAE